MRLAAILAALLLAISAGADESFEATKAKAEQGDLSTLQRPDLTSEIFDAFMCGSGP